MIDCDGRKLGNGFLDAMVMEKWKIFRKKSGCKLV